MSASGQSPRLVLATTNAAKIREIADALAGVPYELVSLASSGRLHEPEESASTFEGNARIKALSYAEQIGAMVVAEDSGLEVDALDRWPGVLTARVPGATYPEKWAEVYRRLHARGVRSSTARFVCALVLARPGEVLYEARGTVEGSIAESPAGEGGFGYDPIFYYPPMGRTTAEMSLEEKRRVSHRGRAFAELRRFLLTEPALCP